MKVIAAVLIALSIAACSPMDHASVSMNQARTFTDYDKGCKSKARWMECDGYRSTSEANGGSGE